MNLNEDVIRTYAHQIWEAEGQPDGLAKQHWERAIILAAGKANAGQVGLKKSIDPSEASGPTEPPQPDQT